MERLNETAQDWVCVSVQSASGAGTLRSAEKLKVVVYDPHRRATVLQRISQNVSVLLLGVAARRCEGAEGSSVKFADFVPGAMKSASVQRSMLRALGIIMGAVGVKGREPVLDERSEYFVTDVGRVLWALFAKLRNQASDLGSRDFASVIADESSCRAVLRSFGEVPSFARAGDTSSLASWAAPGAVIKGA